jgi:hypothetical protein
MKDDIFSVKLVKKDGKLTHQNSGDLLIYRNFVNSLEEGQIVETFFEANSKGNSKAQLAKIHVCIRKLANEIGYTFEEMKLSIKQRAGLVYGELDTSDGYAKSFAECSHDEIQLVFEALNEAGEMVNLRF